MKNNDKAIELLNKSINDYSGYLYENYVHIRGFAVLRELGACNGQQGADDHNFYTIKIDHLPIDESIRLAGDVFEHVMRNNGIEEALGTIEPYCDKSIYHCFVRTFYLILIALTTMEKDDVQKAHKGIEDMVKLMELHSELVHSYGYACSAVVLGIETHSVFSLIRVAYRLQKFVNNFRYCKVILRTRSQWESESSRLNYEAAVRLANGVSHLVISNVPPKILRVINFLGIKGVERIGWSNLNRAAFELPGLSSQLARLARIIYWCYIEPHGCLGPINYDICKEILDKELEKYPQNLLLNMFRAKLVQLSGQIETAISMYNRMMADTGMTYLRFIYFELMWCYGLVGNWDQCVEYAHKFRTGSLFSPAIATYMEAIFRYTRAVEINDSDEKHRATKLFEVVPGLRIRHVGKTITPEKMAIVRSEKYMKCDEMLILPDVREQAESDYIDNYLMAKYFQGVIWRLMGEYEKASKCIEVIFENDGRIGREYSLPAQAALEMGLIEYELKNHEKAIELLNKCINEYSGYLSENIVHVRAFAALRELGVGNEKLGEDETKLEEYKKQWLKDIKIDRKKYDQLLETEEKTININVYSISELARHYLFIDHLPIDESIRLTGDIFEHVMKTNGIEEGLVTIEPYCDKRRCSKSQQRN
ncbi:unnamed protein product [Oppiella nova]|uniref:Uncharacterized protein n=1 Tax=Oppiella nova TaxID=334625 RepID=A0A7R9QD49_9ACAR|nr:unnamed protein product [Oppiella nova]CAG2163421.1 unnamed protein product [Oppiella nova]